MWPFGVVAADAEPAAREQRGWEIESRQALLKSLAPRLPASLAADAERA